MQSAFMGKHGSALIRHGQEIAMTLQALGIFDALVGFFPLFFADVVVASGGYVNGHVLDAVPGFGEKEIHRVMRSRQVAVHAIGHQPLWIVHMR